MTVKAGDLLPEGKLMESTEFDSATHCAMAPKEVDVIEATKGKKVVIFGLPGAYTPTCSAKHVPSYVENLDKLKAKGVSEVWCVATNDAFVMAHPLPRRRQRQLDQGAGPGPGSERPRHGFPHAALLDAGGRRQDQVDQHRRPGQIRGFRRRHHAEAGLSNTLIQMVTNPHTAGL